MSGLEGLSLDADGFVDMDQFPDDGTDLVDADLAALRDALHSDPVIEPTDDEWDALFDSVMDDADGGPFSVDGAEVDLDASAVVADDDAFDTALATEDDLDDAGTTDDVDPDDADVAVDDGIDDGIDDGFGDGLAPVDDVDLGTDPYDDGGLDLTPDGNEDPFAADGVDDVPADIANNDFEDLL